MDYDCPSCGAAVIFKSRSTVFSICSFCKSMLVRHDLDLESLGKMSDLLEDMSPLQIGTRGQYEKRKFEILGRVKIAWPQGSCDGGSWNEWFIQLESPNGAQPGWLAEAQGFYMVSFQEDDLRGVPPVQELVPGKAIALGNRRIYTVDDIKKAQCIGAQGELPFRAPQGRKNISVDLSGAEGDFASLDYSDEGVKLYLGQYVEFEEFKFTGLRALDGW